MPDPTPPGKVNEDASARYHVTGFIWSDPDEGAGGASPPKQPGLSPSATGLITLDISKPNRDSLALVLPPRYVNVALGRELIALPEVPAVLSLGRGDGESLQTRMTRIAELMFATGGVQRVQQIEYQIAFVCAAFSPPEEREQYLGPAFRQSDPVLNLLGSALPAMPWGHGVGWPASSLLTDEGLAGFRSRVFPPQLPRTSSALDLPAQGLATRTLALWRAGARAHAVERLKQLADVEESIREAGKQRMKQSMRLAVEEFQRYTGMQPESGEALLSNPGKVPSMPIQRSSKGTQSLERAIAALKPLAEEITKAHEEFAKTASGRMVAGIVRDPEYEAKLRREILVPALAAFSAAVTEQAQAHPVLFRVPAETIVEIANRGIRAFRLPLTRMLRRTFQSARHMYNLLDGAPGAAEGVRIGVGDAWLTDIDVEETFAQQVMRDDMLWRYPKLIQAGLEGLDSEDPSGATRAAALVMEKLGPLRGERAIRDIGIAALELSGYIAADVLLTAVAPPLGAAFNLAMSGAGVFDAIDDYGEKSAPYFCALDPTLALAEAEPGATGIVLSVAFAAFDLAPVLRGAARLAP